MRNVLLLIAALTAATGRAAEAADTTFTAYGKQIAVSDSNGMMRISVYDEDGGRLTKANETSYINGQEIERVLHYVS